ncbi:hypothetical protein IM40_10425 (plasmid) [Candidatus Paracaedimonas acanthamoebae]|nr:hypothetical protein IM40_10425 [Candidatus Paracaedimonas acanthamoebae]
MSLKKILISSFSLAAIGAFNNYSFATNPQDQGSIDEMKAHIEHEVGKMQADMPRIHQEAHELAQNTATFKPRPSSNKSTESSDSSKRK